MIAAITGGKIPEKHRLQPVIPVLNPVKYDDEIRDQGFASQSYDRGLERFVVNMTHQPR
jgi:hypothetical protein